MDHEFAGSLYRNTTALLAAVAEHFMTAGGANSRETILTYFADDTDADMAAECLSNWGLEEHLEQWGVTTADLAHAISRYRASLVS